MKVKEEYFQGFLLTVRADTTYRHLFPSKEKTFVMLLLTNKLFPASYYRHLLGLLIYSFTKSSEYFCSKTFNCFFMLVIPAVLIKFVVTAHVVVPMKLICFIWK